MDIALGVIGNGFVGSAVVHGFNHFVKSVKVFDKDQNKTSHSLQETLGQDIVFVCLPTPMSLSEDGKCDLSIVESFFSEVSILSPDCIFVIKSTVPVGTTSILQKKYNKLKILHSPEFLTARTSLLDFITPSRNIIGYPKEFYSNMHSVPNKVVELFEKRFPGVKTFLMDSDSTEMIKYVANCFFATKISYFNEVKLLCDKLDLDYEEILEGVLSDGRIGISHHQVPGHDGKLGFGGTCFPKDINSFINLMKLNGIDPKVLQSAWDRNVSVRPEKDWEKFSAAVSTGTKEFDLSGCGHDHI